MLDFSLIISGIKIVEIKKEEIKVTMKFPIFKSLIWIANLMNKITEVDNMMNFQ